LPRKCIGHSTHPIPTITREESTFGLHQVVNTKIRLIVFFAAKDRGLWKLPDGRVFLRG